MGFFRDRQIKKTLHRQIQEERDKKAAGFDKFHENKTKKKKGFFEVIKEDAKKVGGVVKDATAAMNKASNTKKKPSKSIFDKGNSMFGGGKGASFGGNIGLASNKPASMTSQGWGVGGAMAMDKPKKAPKKRKKAARKGKVKKVVYYN